MIKHAKVGTMRLIPVAAILILVPGLAACTAKARVDLSGVEQDNPRPGAVEPALSREPPPLLQPYETGVRSGAGRLDADRGADQGMRRVPAETLGWRAAKPASEQGENQVIVVREGDTLYDIARRHGVPVATLFSVNGLVTDKLVPGQQIVVPQKP